MHRVVSIAAVVAAMLGVWLAFVQPFAGRRRYRRFLERLRHDPSARLRHYLQGIAAEAAGAALVGLLALLAHSRMRSLWPPGDNTKVADQIPGLVIGLLLVTVIYRIGGRRARRALAFQLRPVAALLPRTRRERWTFALLAVSAGVCEELLYRGFGLAALRWALPGVGNPALIAVTAVAFGLAHLYQGWPGMMLTGLLGGYFGWIVVSTGSLLPVMLVHAVVDLRILGLPLDAVPFPSPEARL